MKRNLIMGMLVVSTLLTQFGSTRVMGEENEEDQKLFEAGQKWECKWYDSKIKPMFQLTSEGTESVGQLTYDFSQGGTYVEANNANVSISAEYKELRFFVKSATKATILVQFMNGFGECYQFLPSYQDAGKWQEVRVALGGKTTDHFKDNLHLPNDGPWNFPLNMLQLGVVHYQKNGMESGDVFFKKVVLVK